MLEDFAKHTLMMRASRPLLTVGLARSTTTGGLGPGRCRWCPDAERDLGILEETAAAARFGEDRRDPGQPAKIAQTGIDFRCNRQLHSSRQATGKAGGSLDLAAQIGGVSFEMLTSESIPLTSMGPRSFARRLNSPRSAGISAR